MRAVGAREEAVRNECAHATYCTRVHLVGVALATDALRSLQRVQYDGGAAREHCASAQIFDRELTAATSASVWQGHGYGNLELKQGRDLERAWELFAGSHTGPWRTLLSPGILAARSLRRRGAQWRIDAAIPAPKGRKKRAINAAA